MVAAGLALAVAGCSSDDDGGDRAAAPGATDAPQGTVTTLPAVPPGSVTVVPAPPDTPARVTPQERPSGDDEVAQQSAARVTDCAAQGSCQSVEAPKVAWPGADLTQQDFSFAVLTGADFRQVRAVLTNFTGASLSGANFAGANLSGANLSGADLVGANLTLADLRGADLRGAQLQNALLDGATLDAARFCQTRMPDGSERNDACPPPAP